MLTNDLLRLNSNEHLFAKELSVFRGNVVDDILTNTANLHLIQSVNQILIRSVVRCLDDNSQRRNLLAINLTILQLVKLLIVNRIRILSRVFQLLASSSSFAFIIAATGTVPSSVT